ncbi:MAG: NAD(P)-binding domain-containing protein, partial [Candidatus Omnitrophota bacterium]
MSKVRVAVIGAAGYSGEELVKTLCRHPQVQVTYVSGKEERQVTIADLFPYLRGTLELPCKAFDFEEAVAAADIFFLCLPHTASMQVVPALLTAKKLVVDLSADYRLKDIAVYEQFYKTPHGDPDNLSTAIYGLP